MHTVPGGIRGESEKNIMKAREKNIAEEFNILDRIQKLESELLNIEGITDVDFDLCEFYDNMNQVIFLTKYDIQVNTKDYFEMRRQLIMKVINVSKIMG